MRTICSEGEVARFILRVTDSTYRGKWVIEALRVKTEDAQDKSVRGRHLTKEERRVTKNKRRM